jgi:hypothetical protein
VRPGTIEIRQVARSLALELSSAYESYELVGAEPRLPRAIKPRRGLALTAEPSDETCIVDPDALEFGVTELVPTIRKPRWTPEIELSSHQGRPPITPKGVRDEVAGEIELKKRR